jgi:hypothetical protein
MVARLAGNEPRTVIEVEDLIDPDEEFQALEASESLTHFATAPSMC